MKTHINTILFGGTFDPIHSGHIGMVESLLKKVNIQKMIIIPNKQSPHKQSPIASIKERLELLEIALNYFPLSNQVNYEISKIELKRQCPSYMYDTVNILQSNLTNLPVGLLIGGDSFLSFHKWYKYQLLAKNIKFLVVPRGNVNMDEYYYYQLKHQLNCIFLSSTLKISASEIRKYKKKSGIKEVDLYIKKNRVYK